MNPPNDSEARVVMRCIALYLRRNPLASDTAEGIARWWLGDMAVGPDSVQRALDELTRLGVLIVQVAADGRRRYRLLSGEAVLDPLFDSSDGRTH